MTYQAVKEWVMVTEFGSYCLQITEPQLKPIKMQQWKVSVIAYHAIL